VGGRLLAAFLVAGAMAGCTGAELGPTAGPGLDERDGEEIAGSVDVQATATTGVIRCVAVDADITPLAGVLVELSPGGRSTTTDHKGACGFEGLEPRAYLVHATKDGHSATQATADVRAGVDDPPFVRLVLPEIGSAASWHTIKDELYVSSAWSVNGEEIFGLGTTENILSGMIIREHAANATWLQTEVVWEPTTLLAREVVLDCSLSASLYGTGASHNHRVAGPAMLPWSLEVDLMPGAPLRQFCYFVPVENAPVPFGAILHQDFQAFTTVFYGMLPEPGWLLTTDGHPAPP
jgi:hypothetical protein